MQQKRKIAPSGKMWLLGKLRFDGYKRVPTIIDARGISFRISIARLDPRLQNVAKGYLVAFCCDAGRGPASQVRPVSSAERSYWLRLIEKHARRKRSKIVKRQQQEVLASCKTPLIQWPSSTLAATKVFRKRGRTRVIAKKSSVFSLAQGQTRKVGSHRDNTGHG
jgi:hypothetical protein